MKEENRKKIQDAIQEANRIVLRREAKRSEDELLRDKPGAMYVVDHDKDIAIQIVLVRYHPDDPMLTLVVPCDDFPLAGTPDERLVDLGDPWIARCGECTFVLRECLSDFPYVGFIQSANLANIKVKIHELATGKDVVSCPEVDCDPEYISHMEEIQSIIRKGLCG